MEQTTRKTNKKKLVVALALLALIVVASVITTVVLVLAAGQQNVNSNVNVVYTVTDVSATVSAKYGRVGDTALVNMTIGGEAETAGNVAYTFMPSQETTAAALAPQKAHETYANGTIGLQSGKPYAIFEYKFVNNSDEKAFSVGLTYTDTGDTDKNIVTGYFTSDAADGIAIASLNGITREESAWVSSGFTVTDLAAGTATSPVTCSEVLYVYAIVMIDDLNAGALFSGSFNFTLTAVDMPSQG